MHALHGFLLFHLLTCLGLHALGSEIINGKKVPENLMLYMASVQNEGQHVCGGFLINEDFVLTAAHCDCLGITRVVLGTHNLNKTDNGNIRYIKERYKHPSYETVGKGKDIMLLKLAEKARLDNRVQTIPLPTPETNIKENQRCSVAGWGYTSTGGGAVDDLRVVNVSVMNLQDCKEKWSGLPLPDSVICAGGYETDKGFCQGDSGGPLVCDEKAVGVVSFNKFANCNYPDVPNVYTDISKHLPWIKSIINRYE
ncbi:hypothetical protein ABVT39_012748 [Epinephelus coioides]